MRRKSSWFPRGQFWDQELKPESGESWVLQRAGKKQEEAPEDSQEFITNQLTDCNCNSVTLSRCSVNVC